MVETGHPARELTSKVRLGESAEQQVVGWCDERNVTGCMGKGLHNREFKIVVYRANVKPLRYNTARDPSTFNVAVCRSRLYV